MGLVESGKLPWPTNPYETNHNLFYWALLCDYWAKTELAAEELHRAHRRGHVRVAGEDLGSLPARLTGSE